MRTPLALLRDTFASASTPDDASLDRPSTVLYECSDCRSMIINPEDDRCPQCETGSLARR